MSGMWRIYKTWRHKTITREEAKKCIGKGWGSLIDRLYDNKPSDTKVYDVKEKFGGLRFYVGGATKKYYKLIDKMETKSFKICEFCGNPGKPNSENYWIKTVCDECNVKLGI